MEAQIAALMEQLSLDGGGDDNHSINHDILNRKLSEIHSFIKNFSGGEDEAGTEKPRTPLPVSHRDLVTPCKQIILDANDQIRPDTKALSCQLLAEIARTDEGRTVCLQMEVISALPQVLGDCPVETTVQVCRILGNLCFDCSKGRDQVIQSNCLPLIKEVALNQEKKQEDPGQRFPVILPGFLLNFANDSPKSIEAIGQLEYQKIIVSNILATKTNDAVFNSSLSFFLCLADEEVGIKYLQECDLASALSHILQCTTSPEVTETTLELIRSLAEEPVLTLNMAKSELCTTMVKHIVGRWRCKEFEDHRSDACDLLVLILSHDESMKHIYKTDNGKFLQTFLSWLEKDDMLLKVTSSLAIGNFACNEDNCLELMEKGISVTLIALLKAHQNPAHDLKLQHAILGSLRNLAVTPVARKQLLDQGLLDPCLRLTDKLSMLNAQPVIFKLLATLRLIMDGYPDVAQKLAKSRQSVGKFVEWGTSDAQGLKAESGRLLAAMIKHSNSAAVVETVIECGGLPHIAVMLMSQHLRMLNEALIALSVAATVLKAETTVAQLHTDLVINGIKGCLRDDNHPVEVKKNALTLTECLVSADPASFIPMLKDLEFSEVLKHPSIADLEQTKNMVKRISR